MVHFTGNITIYVHFLTSSRQEDYYWILILNVSDKHQLAMRQTKHIKAVFPERNFRSPTNLLLMPKIPSVTRETILDRETENASTVNILQN